MEYASRLITVTDCDEPCTIPEFIEANADGLDQMTIDELLDLPIGGKMFLGGGASPEVTVQRIAGDDPVAPTASE